jgi:hypothetical protein
VVVLLCQDLQLTAGGSYESDRRTKQMNCPSSQIISGKKEKRKRKKC